MGKGQAAVDRLSDNIDTLKHVIIYLNSLIVMITLAVFSLCLWIRFEPGLEEWIKFLDIEKFYIGTYVLIFASLVIIAGSVFGCFSAFAENTLAFLLFIGSQVFAFVCGVAGSATLLQYSTQHSSIQPMIRESMRKLIMNTHHEPSQRMLQIIQENIGCCGADGARDYTSLRQPLPNHCRDTVTGNPYFHGCSDELVWFFEEKTMWVAGLAMLLCMANIINIAITVTLMKALKKEDDMKPTINHHYRND